MLTLAKEVKRTGKVIKFDTPQVVMYGESEYEKNEEMSHQVENVLSECWQYINGKGESETQLPLFANIQELV